MYTTNDLTKAILGVIRSERAKKAQGRTEVDMSTTGNNNDGGQNPLQARSNDLANAKKRVGDDPGRGKEDFNDDAPTTIAGVVRTACARNDMFARARERNANAGRDIATKAEADWDERMAVVRQQHCNLGGGVSTIAAVASARRRQIDRERAAEKAKK